MTRSSTGLDKRVPAEGPADARIMFVGEAPGSKEVELLRPFVGGAGRVLDGLLVDAQITRPSCYFTNLVKYRPKANDFGTFYDGKTPRPILVDGYNEVVREISKIKPHVVVPLGAEPLKWLTGKLGITKWRGSILSHPIDRSGLAVGDFYRQKFVATFHPAAVLRNWQYRPIALFDLQRVKEQSEFPEVRLKERHLKINPKYDEVIAELRRMNNPGRLVSFDIEMETAQITCIGFADSADRAICVPFWFGASGSYWSREQELNIWCEIKSLLENAEVGKIAQNAQYDMTMLADIMDIQVQGLYMDTMIAGHLCYPELPKGLDFLTSLYTDQPYYKDMIRTERMDEFFVYNALDACCTYEVATEVRKELHELQLWEFYKRYVHRLIRPLMDISRRGVRIDTDLRRMMQKEYREKITRLQEDLNTAVGHELNVASPKQMSQWLYTELGFPEMKRKRGKYGNNQTTTTDAETIRELHRRSPRTEFEIILNMRKAKKTLSTYLEAPIDKDGRIRTTYLITGTETGRLSSRESVHGTGTNLQNVPKGIARRLFIPDDGCIFISGDLSQAEARIVAYLAGEDALIRLFASGGDIHRRNASSIFRVEEPLVTSHQRQLAKRVVHASNYGMGHVTFAKNAGIPTHESRRLLNAYFATYPGIKMWQLRVTSELRRSRVLTTPLGRRRLFMGTFNESLKKEAFAYVPQSTVADILNQGLLELESQLPLDSHIMLQVHDSVVVQTPVDKFGITCELIADCLTRPLDIEGRTCTIPVELEAGRNWNMMKPVTVPYRIPVFDGGDNETSG